MVNIGYFHDFTFAVINKVQSGNTVTPSQFDSFCNQSQLYKFEQDRSTFVQTGIVSNYLQSFFVDNYTQIVDPSTGQVNYPDNLQHTSSVGSYYNGNKYPADLIEATRWRDILISQLNQPTLRFPKYVQYASYYEFAPKTIGTVFIDYFATPIAPHWGFTVVNDEDVYDPLTSIDFQWDIFSMNEIAGVFFQLCGVDLKDFDLYGFSEQFKQENKSLL